MDAPTDHSTALAEALARTAAAPENEVHAVLCARLMMLGTTTAPGLRLGRVLEIGSYGHPGLALLLLMMGAEHVTLNNQKPVINRLSKAWVSNLVTLTAHNPSVRKDWRSFLVEDDAGYAVRPDLLTVIGEADAAQIALPEHSLDFVLSLSVLEHMRRLPDVFAHLRRLIRPGGSMWHWVDVRDHTSFTDPLRFLRLTTEDFEAAYTPDNNRWRPSDYAAMAETAGFDVKERRYFSQNPMSGAGSDMMWFIREDLDRHLPRALEKVEPWVTGQMRDDLHPDYQHHSLNELSVTGFSLFAAAPV
jgi:SAM-dependent methyltransferase